MVNKLLVALSLFIGCNAQALTLFNKDTGYKVETSRVAHISGVIDVPALLAFEHEMANIIHKRGPLVIVIDSPGGRVDIDHFFVKMVEELKANGTKVICVVPRAAHSMAFNILNHCSVRLGGPQALFVVHKIAIGSLCDPGIRLTAKALREMADELDKSDVEFSAYNARAMHLTLDEYNTYSDRQEPWFSGDLYLQHYLNEIVTIK